MRGQLETSRWKPSIQKQTVAQPSLVLRVRSVPPPCYTSPRRYAPSIWSLSQVGYIVGCAELPEGNNPTNDNQVPEQQQQEDSPNVPPRRDGLPLSSSSSCQAVQKALHCVSKLVQQECNTNLPLYVADEILCITQPILPLCTPLELVDLLVDLASWRVRPHQQWVDEAAQCLRVYLPSLDARTTFSLLQALARQVLLPRGGFLTDLCSAWQHHLVGTTVPLKVLASSLKYLHTLGQKPSPGLVKACSAAALWHVDRFTPKHQGPSPASSPLHTTSSDLSDGKEEQESSVHTMDLVQLVHAAAKSRVDLDHRVWKAVWECTWPGSCSKYSAGTGQLMHTTATKLLHAALKLDQTPPPGWTEAFLQQLVTPQQLANHMPSELSYLLSALGRIITPERPSLARRKSEQYPPRLTPGHRHALLARLVEVLPDVSADKLPYTLEAVASLQLLQPELLPHASAANTALPTPEEAMAEAGHTAGTAAAAAAEDDADNAPSTSASTDSSGTHTIIVSSTLPPDMDFSSQHSSSRCSSLTDAAINGIIDALILRLPGISGCGLSNSLHALSAMGLHLGPEEQIMCLRRLHTFLPHLNSQDLASVIASIARLGWRPADAWLSAFLKLSKPKLHAASPGQLTAILTALADIDCRPATAWLDHALAVAAGGMSRYSPSQLEQLGRACVAFGHHPETTWMGWFADKALLQFRVADSKALVGIAWALSSLGYRPGEKWIQAFCIHMDQRLQYSEPHCIVLALRCLVTWGSKPPLSWVAHLEAGGSWKGCNSQDLAVLIRALAMCGARPPDVWLDCFMRTFIAQVLPLGAQPAESEPSGEQRRLFGQQGALSLYQATTVQPEQQAAPANAPHQQQEQQHLQQAAGKPSPKDPSRVAQHIAIVLQAFARLGTRPPAAHAQQLLQAFQAVMGPAHFRTLAMAVVALAHLGLRPGRDWTGAFLLNAHRRLVNEWQQPRPLSQPLPSAADGDGGGAGPTSMMSAPPAGAHGSHPPTVADGHGSDFPPPVISDDDFPLPAGDDDVEDPDEEEHDPGEADLGSILPPPAAVSMSPMTEPAAQLEEAMQQQASDEQQQPYEQQQAGVSLALILWSLAHLGIAPGSRWFRAYEGAVSRGAAAGLGLRARVLSLFALTKLGKHEQHPQQQWELSRELLRHLVPPPSMLLSDECTAHDLAMLLWALGRQCVRPGRKWQAVVVAAVAQRLEEFSLQGLILVCWGLARLKTRPPQQLQTALARKLELYLQQMSPPQLAQVLWAFAWWNRPGFTGAVRWLDAVVSRSRALLPECSPEALVCIIWALTRLGAKLTPRWLAAFGKELQPRLPHMRGQSVAVALWAITKQGGRLPPDWAAFARTCIEKRKGEVACALLFDQTLERLM